MKNILLIQFALDVSFANASINNNVNIQMTNQIRAYRKAEYPRGVEKMNSWINKT